MRRIGWQPKSHADYLETMLNRQLAQWGVDWLGGESLGALLVRDSSDEIAFNDCRRLTSGEAIAWFQYEEELELTLGLEVLRLKTSRSVDFVREIGRQCLHQLQERLFGDNGALIDSSKTPPVAADYERRFGALCFELAGTPGPMTMTVNRAWCNRQEPAMESTKALAQLTERREALGSTSITLSACLPLGEISLLDSLTWRVGEVLVAETMTAPSVNLMAGQSHIASGRMLMQQKGRAVELE